MGADNSARDRAGFVVVVPLPSLPRTVQRGAPIGNDRNARRPHQGVSLQIHVAIGFRGQGGEPEHTQCAEGAKEGVHGANAVCRVRDVDAYEGPEGPEWMSAAADDQIGLDQLHLTDATLVTPTLPFSPPVLDFVFSRRLYPERIAEFAEEPQVGLEVDGRCDALGHDVTLVT